MKISVGKIKSPKMSFHQLRLNRVQRKELARVTLDVAKTMFLTVVASYFFPPLIGFEGKVELGIAIKGVEGVVAFLFIGTSLLEVVRE